MSVVVVTGGTSGIGQKLVEQFAGEGWDVVFNGRRERLGKRIADQTGATFVCGDVNDEITAITTIQAAAKGFGRLDCLINNAGKVSDYRGIRVAGVLDFAAPLSLHVIAAMLHIRYAVPLMVEGGSVINIASTAGHRGFGEGRAPYAVSKAALIALSHSLAAELKAFKIRINSISPGKMHEGYDPVVSAVMFLASEQSHFITGTDIIVDGGQTAGVP